MTVKQIRKKLEDYNEDAEFVVVVRNNPVEFEICFGNSEGVTKQNCESVCIYVESSEEQKQI
jgi:hypothetical protein